MSVGELVVNARWGRIWTSAGDNASRLVAVVTVGYVVATSIGGILVARGSISVTALALTCLSLATFALISSTTFLLVLLRRRSAYAHTLNLIFRESHVLLDGLALGLARNPNLNDQAKIRDCLDVLLMFGRDYVAPGKEKVLSFLKYNSEGQSFDRVARCPAHSTSIGLHLANMRLNNCLAGRSLVDHEVKYVSDVTSSDAKNAGFNNELGRPLVGSVVDAPVFGKGNEPFGVLDCHCFDTNAFSKGDIELLTVLSLKITLLYAVFDRLDGGSGGG